jgi:SAM-dependent methyltransferase
MNNTSSSEYFEELRKNSNVKWKKFILAQLPYVINLRIHLRGSTLEVGCGLGRNLKRLGPSSVGVEHNPNSVQVCKDLGLSAYLPDEFRKMFKSKINLFDNLLMSHVLEHVTDQEQASIMSEYIPYLKRRARIFIITPQEKGFSLTDSHINWTDFNKIKGLLEKSAPGFSLTKAYSFPFPRIAGKLFNYNEFNVVADRT